MDAILARGLEALTSLAADKIKDRLARTEVVARAMSAVGLKPDKPPADFDGVYVYSLIQYGVGRPAAALELFRQPEIRSAFRRSFDRDDPNVLEKEAADFLEWNRIGDDLRAANIDPRREFALYSVAFHETVDATRDPADTRRDQQLAAILEKLNDIPDLSSIRAELASLQQASRARQFGLPATGGKLKIFISSRMKELRDPRSILQEALEQRGFNPFLYESGAGSRPDTVVEASLSEVEAADVYLGMFGSGYGEITIEEYRHARNLNKPCFVYIRDQGAKREPRLKRFLESEVMNPQTGVASSFFDTAPQLAKQAADNIMSWLVGEYRKKSALVRDAGTSREEQERLRKELDRLRSLVQQNLPEGGGVDLLGANLESWFRVSGYPVEASDLDAPGRYARIINVPERDRKSVRVLVHAVEGPAELHHLNGLRRAAEENRVGEAWLITAARKTPAVVKAIANPEAASRLKLACYTFDELIDLGADFTAYFNWLETEVEDRGIDKRYIPLAATKAEFDPETNQRLGESVFEDDTDSYIDQWLSDPSKEHISILGQFGTGKTWFALHYAWVALRRYREAQSQGLPRPRLPIYIPLRDYAKAVDVKNLLSEFFFSKQQIDIRNYSMFEELNRMGRFLLIFDGFDEMADRVDREKVIEHFWKLAQVVAPRSKVILTSRTEHFPNDEVSRKLLSAELQAATSNLKMTSPKFEVLELRQLTPDQIRRLLEGHGLSAEAVARVMKNRQLLDLASRPVMIDLIQESLTEIQRGDRIDISRIYLYATRRKMERDISSGRTFTSLPDKLYFLCELAWAMLSQKKLTLNYKDFPAEIGRVFGDRMKGPAERDHFQYDMLGQTMLIRKDGDYSPAHRSLLEFWAAYKLAAEMGILAEDFTAAARQQAGVDFNAPPEDRTWSQHFGSAASGTSPLGRFIPESVDRQKKTAGFGAITPAIRDLLVPMLDQGAPAVLLSVIRNSVEDPDPAAAIMAANALTMLLALDPESARQTSFAAARFKSLNLEKTDLTGVRFSLAVFEDCELIRVNLCRPRMSKTTWAHCKVYAEDLRHAVLRGAAFSHSRFKLADVYPRVSMNAAGLLAVQQVSEGVQLWDIRLGKKAGSITTKYIQSLLFVTPALLCIQHYTGAKLWDVSNPATPVEAYWPGTLKGSAIRAVAPIDESGRAWVLLRESLIQVNITTGEISRPIKTAVDAAVLAAAPDGISVAVGGSILEWWRGSQGYFYDPNKNRDGGSKLRDFTLLAFSPSSRFLACFTKPDYRDDQSVMPSFVIDAETREVTSWDFTESRGVGFATESLLMNFARSDLRLLDLTAGKRVLKLPYEYANTCTLNASCTALLFGDLEGAFHLLDVRPFLSPESGLTPLFPGDPGVDPGILSSDEAAWPEWWRTTDPRIAVPEGHVPNPRFGKTAFSMVADDRCEHMEFTGATGLEPDVRDRFIARGATYKPGVLERLKKLIG